MKFRSASSIVAFLAIGTVTVIALFFTAGAQSHASSVNSSISSSVSGLKQNPNSSLSTVSSNKTEATGYKSINSSSGSVSRSSVLSSNLTQHNHIVYNNTEYHFKFYLPSSWKGYTIINSSWAASKAITGPIIYIRNPAWTQSNPYEDLPIMIFTTDQWNSLKNGNFNVSGASMDPKKLGSNQNYVFATPPRWFFDMKTEANSAIQFMNSDPLCAY